ncbi:tRNA dihydrouridine synthase DusB [Porticoccaceae bacterium]|nr:tRNA dihydrouridine synthase DusB [Porticoccaceae bacterium]MDA8597579.1 tRNA dihydrouridine synthase DusB [Porticoccaceae bacterium]MDB2395224.1 tRNA dihydrouridine synthase DusB [Porticoccaceae bacterium]MDB2400169.1 tRNA dihydrouridine synthase DusB [Porticoccaceae bacterium]MDG1782132.1 tRNA dihydrouridine synthase DusB [Porticoccaceae bacterium]
MFNIGPYQIQNQTVLAPMAGVTDLPFRRLCRKMGAGLVVSEMVAADPNTWSTRKSRLRVQFGDEPAPRSVQIAGYDPQMMAEAALFNVQLGAEIIDINMGCPAKKVCKRAAGSALLQNPELVESILTAVVSAVDVPVTLKIRTGWDRQNRNAKTIARIAEDSGVAALAVHGRTKACRFVGEVEYDTIAKVVDAVSIPVLANGDITDPQRAVSVLKHTGAAAVMIGRAAQGNPWIFNQINHFLKYDQPLSPPSMEECSQVMSEHLLALHEFYGETGGVRISRKHIGWYINPLPGGKEFTRVFNTLETTEQQRHFLQSFFLDLNCEEQVA